MIESKYNIGDKVKLKYPINIDFIDEWKEFWCNNKNTIFIVYSKKYIYHMEEYKYNLTCLNGKVVISPDCSYDSISNSSINNANFFDHELELYITTNHLPDELFEME